MLGCLVNEQFGSKNVFFKELFSYKNIFGVYFQLKLELIDILHDF